MSKELNSGEGERMIDKMSEIDLSDWVKSGKPLSEYKADIADREKSNPGGLTDEGMEYLKENQDGGRLEDGRFSTQDGKGAFDTEEEAQAYDAEVRQENVEKIRATAEAGGRDLGQDIQQLREVAAQLNPAEATGFEDTYIPNLAENNQSWLSDFGESLYEGLILDTLKGVTNLIPTVTQAFSENASHSVEKGHDWKDHWTTGWIENTTAWFDGISPTYSDAYYKGDGYRKLATGLGQGFGFVGGIMLGGSAIAQGLGKGLGMVNKVAKLNKYGEIVGQVGKPTKWANRIGSFTAGTTMMYPMVYEEAIQKGVNPVHAARLALGIAGVVSTTEGMALEWIGKSMSKPLIKKATKEVLNKELVKLGKTTSLKEVYALEKNFTKGFVEKLKAMGPKVFQGSAIEFGQEFSQTYIEEGMKQMYDGTIGKGKKEGEGNFGADIGTFETFKEAAWGGLIGAIVGGTLPAAGNIRGKVEQESLFSYVNQNVRRKKPNNNFQLEKSIRELEASGRLTPDQANKASDEIKNMVRFSTETKGLNINSGIANYQLFQLSENNKTIKEKFDKTFRESETLPSAVAATYVMNKKMGNEIATAINEDMSTIIEDKQAWTKNKVKFEKRIGLYNKLALKVVRNEITEEDFTKELKSITDGVSDKIKQQQKKKDKALATKYKTKDGALLNDTAIDNREKIVENYTESVGKNETEALAKIKDEYGIEKDAVKHLLKSQKKTNKQIKDELEVNEIAEKQKDIIEESNKEKTEKAKTAKEEFQADVHKAKRKVEETPHKVGDKVYYSKEDSYDKNTKVEDFVEGTITDVSDVDFMSPEKKIGKEGYRYSVSDKNGNRHLITKPISKAEFESIKEKHDKAKENETASELEKANKEKETKEEVKEEVTESVEETLPEGYRYVKEGEIIPAGDFDTKMSMSGKQTITNAPKSELKDVSFEDDGTPVPEFEESSSEQQTTESIEAKKADIEKRRQGELFYKGNSLQEKADLAKTLDFNDVNDKKLWGVLSTFFNSADEFTSKGEKYTGKEGSSKFYRDIVNSKGEVVITIERNGLEYDIFNTNRGLAKDIISNAESKGFDKVEENNINAKYDAELAALEKPTTQSSEVKSQEQIDDAVNDALDALNNNPTGKSQRVNPNSLNKDTVRNNPKLYEKVKNHFRKIFPNIPVSEVDRIADEYGPEVLGRVVEKGIEIDTSRAFQNTIIHEYAHVYVKILGKDNSIIKKGLELIENTQYFRDAQEAYPELSKDDQLEEALVEAIADNSYEKLRVKFDGDNADKFVAFLKKFWQRIKSKFTKTNAKDIVNIISDGMTFRNMPYTYDAKILQGINKQQRVSRKNVAATAQIQGILSSLRVIKVQNPEFRFDPNDSVQLSQVVYDSLKQRYIKEKSIGWSDSDIKLFEGVSTELVKEETNEDRRANRKAIMELIQDEVPGLYPVVQRSIESFSKNPLPTIDEVTSDSAIKANKKVSESLRSIVTSIIDYNGMSIDSDNIYRYIADVAQNTYGKKGFKKKLEKNAEDGLSIEAIRFNEMLQEMPPNIEQSILSELSSLIQTKYQGIRLIKDPDTGKLVIGKTLINKDESLDSQLNDSYQRLESLTNDFGLSEILEGSEDGKSHWVSLKNKNSYLYPKAKETIEKIFDVSMSEEAFSDFYDVLTEKTDIGMSSFLSQIKKALDKEQSPKKAVSGYATKLFNTISDKSNLTNTFINMSGNSVSSTGFGYFISEQISMMFNKKGHLDLMKKNPILKNNKVLDMISELKRKGINKMDWAVHDAVSNMFTNRTTEHNKQVQSDTLLIGLSYFAASTNKNAYDQSIGISGDRSRMTTFKAPRYKNLVDITKQLEGDVKVQQKMFDNTVKGFEVGSEKYNTILDNFNSMYMNKIVNGKVIAPLMINSNGVSVKNPAYPNTVANEKNIAIINKAIRDNKLEGPLSKDLVGKGKNHMYGSLKELVANYYYTEAINRNALMDIFAGTMLDRKSVADVVKRGSLYNSGGTSIEHNKPVTIVVYDVPSLVYPETETEEGEFTSDSMSFDGSHLHQHTVEDAGELGNVGVNKKDGIMQVDPSTNKVLAMKMSTLGMVDNQDGTTNFDKMGPEYAKIGEMIKKIEARIAEQTGDSKPHVKFVDSKVMKGNDGDYKTSKQKVIKLTDLMNDVANNNFSSLETASFQKEITNHRVAFNLNKDLSKIPLSEQVSVLSTQLRTIASTGATKTQIDEFENSVVNMLKQSLGMSNDNYSDSQTNEELREQEAFLEDLLKGSNEQKSNSISELLYDIKAHNESNPDNLITVYDDPNLVNLVQQAIATKFAKDGIRVEMAGAYLHMIPNYGNDLKGYDYDKTGTESHPEVALPSSMFVEQKEEESDADYKIRAEEFLANAKENGGLRAVVVRVPASKGMSTFVATVKYFTDPKANTVVIPDSFIKAADADHDGDKTFVYREDINKNGTVNKNSLKNKAFEELHKRISSEVLVEETKESLKLKPIKDILEEFGLDETKGYKLTDAVEAAKITEQMAFGQDATGILAIASKMLAVMSQSKEQLKDGQEIRFGYEMTKNPETGVVERRLLFGDSATEFQKFVDDQGADVARLLQAALDMGNDPILMSTGINQESIGVATTLSLLGVDTKSIIGFLTDPDIKNFNKAIFDSNTSFSQGDAKTGDQVRSELIDQASPELGRFKNAADLKNYIKGPLNGVIKKVSESDTLKEGFYRTKNKDAYFLVKSTDIEGEFQVELVEELRGQDAISKIDKYMEIQAISENIQKLIPVLQLDAKLPNNGSSINRLKETFVEIQKEEFPITTDKLLSRPLNKHQKSVSDLQRSVSKLKIITENKSFYDIAEQFKGIPNAKKSVDNSFMQQHAQKNLRTKHSDPKSFIDKFSRDINQILYTSIVGSPNIEDSRWSSLKDKVMELLETKENNPQEYLKDMDALPSRVQESVKELMNEYENALNDFDENSELANNPFMNAVQVRWKEKRDSNGDVIEKYDYLIKSKDNVNRVSPSTLKTIKDGFLKLPQEMQDKFIDYQLLRHGVNEKKGSLMRILPNSLNLKTSTLADISTIANKEETGAREEYFKEERALIQRNVALSMFNNLNEPKFAERINENSDNLLAHNGYESYIKQGENVYERTKETVDFKGNQPNIYKKITNSEFVAGKDFTKFGTSLEESKVTDEQVEEEMKRCKIKS